MTVNVIGRVWAGYDSTYSYEWQGEYRNAMPTLDDVERLAGDFQSIDDFECVQITTKTERLPDGTRFIRDAVVLKAWSKPESEEKFLEAAGY